VATPVLFETKADCLDVILNRPEEGNLITNEMGQGIARVLREIGPEIKLVRLRGLLRLSRRVACLSGLRAKGRL